MALLAPLRGRLPAGQPVLAQASRIPQRLLLVRIVATICGHSGVWRARVAAGGNVCEEARKAHPTVAFDSDVGILSVARPKSRTQMSLEVRLP